MTSLEKKLTPSDIDHHRAEAIDGHRSNNTEKPDSVIIAFRDDKIKKRSRTVESIPLQLIFLRKENGRICTEVESYEKENGLIDQYSEAGQEILKKFLLGKDTNTNDVLEQSLSLSGQEDEAIITADGFLINGNRRRCILEKLHKKYPNDTRFNTMQVVILPGKTDAGGPPTLYEIEQIENRLQLQQTGKSEYKGLDKALSIRRKLNVGMTLFEQSADDPKYAQKPKKGVTDLTKYYTKPLECVDRYLHYFDRPQMYDTIGERWQALIEYSHFCTKYLSDTPESMRNRKKEKLLVDEMDIPQIEETAFKLIRKANIDHLKYKKKMYTIMRDLKNYLKIEESKQALLKVADIDSNVKPFSKEVIKSDDTINPEDVDKMWSNDHNEDFTRYMNIAIKAEAESRDSTTQLELVGDLNKLVSKLEPGELKDKKSANWVMREIKRVIADLEQKLEETDSVRQDLS